ncbi:IS66 family insertion sequence element accessory protein TnpB [Acinetobacter lwoffii]
MCARRLEQGKFHWAKVHQGESMAISPEQLQALIQALNRTGFVGESIF